MPRMFEAGCNTKIVFRVAWQGRLLPYVEITFADSMRIGRKQINELSIDGDRTISAVHCEISQTANGLYIKDLDSTNGTYVNGCEINGLVGLNIGDTVLIGDTELTLVSLENVAPLCFQPEETICAPTQYMQNSLHGDSEI